MTFENILVEQKDRIQYIIINRESKLNALNKATLDELHTAVADAFANAEVGGIIITGAGQKAFVAGADISEFASLDPTGGGKLAREGHANVFNLIENGPKPVIAAVNGFALGGTIMTAGELPASQLIDEKIRDLNDWRGEMLAHVRALIRQADPGVVEEWKWRGVPVWAHDGLICTGETYKNVVKLTFAKGASLDDPSGMFNSSLDGNTRRAIDIHENEKINQAAFQALIRAAVAFNTSNKRTKSR